MAISKFAKMYTKTRRTSEVAMTTSLNVAFRMMTGRVDKALYISICKTSSARLSKSLDRCSRKRKAFNVNKSLSHSGCADLFKDFPVFLEEFHSHSSRVLLFLHGPEDAVVLNLVRDFLYSWACSLRDNRGRPRLRLSAAVCAKYSIHDLGHWHFSEVAHWWHAFEGHCRYRNGQDFFRVWWWSRWNLLIIGMREYSLFTCFLGVL